MTRQVKDGPGQARDAYEASVRQSTRSLYMLIYAGIAKGTLRSPQVAA